MIEEDKTALSAGFMVVHGNQPDALRALLVNWIGRYPLAPLEDEVVLVQSNGIAQWLKLALARDVADGGCGIAAALDAQLPSRFLWQAYRAVLGEAAVPKTSAFDKSQLVWRLMRLLPALLADPARAQTYAALQRFLQNDNDLRKRHQLAERLADLFDQYQVYRADWLAQWAAGSNHIQTSRSGQQAIPDTLRWQPDLWRALLDDVGPVAAETSRADVHRRFLAACATAQGKRPAGLPRRLIVFGISSLPQQALEVLSALSGWMQVLMCVHNPCEHYWANIIADKDLLRAERVRQSRKSGVPEQLDDAEMHLYAHPLLAAWGKQGRDFIGLLDQHDERERYERHFVAISQRIDLFQSNGDATLLQQLQDDILCLRPLSETREIWPPVDSSTDESIRFHITHSAQREVEVLHDQLLAAFAADPSLRPRDVIVMVPDINAYAPHIQAVFGLLDSGDKRFIPFRIADQGQRHQDPLLIALEKLLALPQSRVAVSDVLDLLDVPALRQRFAIEEHQLPLLHRWISAANIRWGLHAEQRHALDLPAGLEQNTWYFGLRRMLLGYAVGAGQAWQSIEPLDEIGGLDAALLGPMVRLLDALDTYWRILRESATPQQWCVRLRGLLGTFFDAEEGEDGYTLLRLDNALQAWLDACEGGGLEEPLPLSVVREHWLQQLDQSGLSQPFFAGAVTFATLMPMRAIPFRRLCLLGMNDGDYPRTRVPMDFDLMGRDYRPGDRSRREDDRYLFLEALLSARDHLHISWVGNSIHDNTERPASVLVAQLRDHLEAGWQSAGTDLLDALTVVHRLQPFNADYFTASSDPRLFSYAHEWRDGLRAVSATPALPVTPVTPAIPAIPMSDTSTLSRFHWEGELTLRHLADFLANPVREFYRLRLSVYFETADALSEDQEPFALDQLDNWQLQDELIQTQLAAMREGLSRDAAVQAQLARMQRRGALPAGEFAGVACAQLIDPMKKLFDEYDAALAAWPRTLEDEPVRYVHGNAPHQIVMADWLTDLRANQDGERARVMLSSTGLTKNGAYRRDKIVLFWIGHLAGHLDGVPLTTVIVSKTGNVTLPPLLLLQAAEYWRELLEAWEEGMTRALPLAVKTAFAWLEKGGLPVAEQGALPPQGRATDAARACYEVDDPDYGRRSELGTNAYLQSMYPSFQALWSGGEFALLADRLLGPILSHVGKQGEKRSGAGSAGSATAPASAVSTKSIKEARA